MSICQVYFLLLFNRLVNQLICIGKKCNAYVTYLLPEVYRLKVGFETIDSLLMGQRTKRAFPSM